MNDNVYISEKKILCDISLLCLDISDEAILSKNFKIYRDFSEFYLTNSKRNHIVRILQREMADLFLSKVLDEMCQESLNKNESKYYIKDFLGRKYEGVHNRQYPLGALESYLQLIKDNGWGEHNRTDYSSPKFLEVQRLVHKRIKQELNSLSSEKNISKWINGINGRVENFDDYAEELEQEEDVEELEDDDYPEPYTPIIQDPTTPIITYDVINYTFNRHGRR